MWQKLPFRFTGIGKWWKKETEIDLMAFDKASRNALFCEVKWKDLSGREALNIIEGLKEKTKKVNGTWKQDYCLIARKIEGKEDLPFLAFDLEDIGREFTLQG
jgi:AAA+ ATPase superfamily predicted ATPase